MDIWMVLTTILATGCQHSVQRALQIELEHQSQIILTQREQQSISMQQEQLKEQLNVVVGAFKEQQKQQNRQSRQLLEELTQRLQQGLNQTLQTSLQNSLDKMNQISLSTAQHLQNFLKGTSKAQTDGVQAIITQVMEGIEFSVGESLRNTTDQFALTIEQQSSSLDRFKVAVDGVSGLMNGLQTTTSAIALGADKMAKAAQPVEAASEIFYQAAGRLEGILESMERAGEQYEKSQKSLEQAHISLQQGTAVYQQSGTTIREMISDLRESHAMAVQRISQGVDESIVGVLREVKVKVRLK